MSLTCVHTVADARLHPECQGCNAIPNSDVRAAQEADRNWAGERGSLWRSISTRPPLDRANHVVIDVPLTTPMPMLADVVTSPAAWDRASSTPIADIRREIERMNQMLSPPITKTETSFSKPGATWTPLPAPSLLPDRPLTPEERSAHDEYPRPGVWAGEPRADLRKLTQVETDQLIRSELCDTATLGERDEVAVAIGGYPGVRPVRLSEEARAARQRGGIDSDPLVRLLAYRAWGDRDRQWFELRGVRKGESVVYAREHDGAHGLVCVALPSESHRIFGQALDDARPGEEVSVRYDPSSTILAVRRRVSDRLRADPSQPRALTPAEASQWSYRRIVAARKHFMREGVPGGELWHEPSVDPGAAVLWHAPAGPGARPPVEERQMLARTWVENGELRYEGPELRYEAQKWQHRPDDRMRAGHWDTSSGDSDDPCPDLDLDSVPVRVVSIDSHIMTLAKPKQPATPVPKPLPPVPPWAKDRKLRNRSSGCNPKSRR